jgi:hypothetical protein
MTLFRKEFPDFFPKHNGNGSGAVVELSPRVSIGRKRLAQMLESALVELRAT